MPSRAAAYNKRREQGVPDEPAVTAASVMHDMALSYINLVAKRPLMSRRFWAYPSKAAGTIPESATPERSEQIQQQREAHAQAADDHEWDVALALGQRYGVKLSEVPAR